MALRRRGELGKTYADGEVIIAEGDEGDCMYVIQEGKADVYVQRDGEEITIRPSKPVDERRIQEHYYSLDKKDVQLRFFHDKISFDRSDVETRSQIDYIKDLTIVAVVGEFGFGKVVGVGEYLLLMDSNTAEVAFSISSEYQGKGLGKLFIRKLARAARTGRHNYRAAWLLERVYRLEPADHQSMVDAAGLAAAALGRRCAVDGHRPERLARPAVELGHVEVGGAVFGNDEANVGPRRDDPGARAEAWHDSGNAFCGTAGEGDDRLATLGGHGAADEIHLPTDARNHPVPDRVGAHLAGEIHFDRRVDRRHFWIAIDDGDAVHVADVVLGNGRIVVDDQDAKAMHVFEDFIGFEPLVHRFDCHRSGCRPQ